MRDIINILNEKVIGRVVQKGGTTNNLIGNAKQDDYPFKYFMNTSIAGVGAEDIVQLYYKDEGRLEEFLKNRRGRDAFEVDKDGNEIEDGTKGVNVDGTTGDDEVASNPKADMDDDDAEVDAIRGMAPTQNDADAKLKRFKELVLKSMSDPKTMQVTSTDFRHILNILSEAALPNLTPEENAEIEKLFNELQSPEVFDNVTDQQELANYLNQYLKKQQQAKATPAEPEADNPPMASMPKDAPNADGPTDAEKQAGAGNLQKMPYKIGDAVGDDNVQAFLDRLKELAAKQSAKESWQPKSFADQLLEALNEALTAAEQEELNAMIAAAKQANISDPAMKSQLDTLVAQVSAAPKSAAAAGTTDAEKAAGAGQAPSTPKTSADLAAFAKSGKGGLANDPDEIAAIKDLQTRLGITADGKYGPNTVAAVKKFQTANKLKADGDAGPNTIAALLKPKGGMAAPKDQEATPPAGETQPVAQTASKVPPRPTGVIASLGGNKISGSKAAWDAKYGKTHNPDGTPKTESRETMKKSMNETASMNISMNAENSAEIAELLGILKNAGMPNAKVVGPMDMPPMDMPPKHMHSPSPCGMEEEEVEEEWDNAPDEEYKDTNYMVKDLAGGEHAPKDRDAIRVKDPKVESLKDRLEKALSEKLDK